MTDRTFFVVNVRRSDDTVEQLAVAPQFADFAEDVFKGLERDGFFNGEEVEFEGGEFVELFFAPAMVFEFDEEEWEVVTKEFAPA